MPMSNRHNVTTSFGRLTRHAALLLLMMTLPGCLIGTTATVTDSGCIIFEPIFYSSQDDTAETIAAVRSHNAAWHATCGDSNDSARHN